MDEHTVLEHLGNLGVILLAVLLSTSVHYLFLKHLNRGARAGSPGRPVSVSGDEPAVENSRLRV